MKAPHPYPTQQGQVANSTLLGRDFGPGTGSLSEQGWARLHSRRFEPLFVADWERAVFLHYSVDAERLQPWVPFPLDCRGGRAWISLVAFTMRGMRLRAAGRVGRWLFAPIATHSFLNLRTYVKVNDEPGIHFIAEWLPNRIAVALGPLVFGLPYRLGTLDYRHSPETGRPVSGAVEGAAGGRLEYRDTSAGDPPLAPCMAASLDEFLLERYTAFVAWRGGRLGYFRVWHQPWPQVRIEPEIFENTLLENAPGGSHWSPTAQFTSAHYSPGAPEVAMGRPHFLPSLNP